MGKMIELIVGAIIGAGLFFSGWFAHDLSKKTTEIINIDSTTYMTTQQKTEVKNYQAQVQTTVIDSKGVYTNFSISLKDLSNNIMNFATNTNYTLSKTNFK